VAAELAGDDLAGAVRVRGEGDELRADEHLDLANLAVAGTTPIGVSTEPELARPGSRLPAPRNSAAQRSAGPK
jgi:hypothetical protein